MKVYLVTRVIVQDDGTELDEVVACFTDREVADRTTFRLNIELKDTDYIKGFRFQSFELDPDERTIEV